MNAKKLRILTDALERVALASGKSNPLELASIATAALKEFREIKEYRITARTWYGRNGGEFRAELVNVETGFKLCAVSGTTWGSDAWSYAMRDAMHAQHPEKFPPHNGGHPTIYFREACGVEYEHAEVARKRDL